MVFGIDDLLLMGIGLAAREGYKRYEQKKRAARISNLSVPVRSPSPIPSPTSSTKSTASYQVTHIPPIAAAVPRPRTRAELYLEHSIGKKKETRILTLKADREDIVLEFSTHNVAESPPEYIALSYSWDDGRDQPVIKDSRLTVDGIIWEVSDNVYQAFVSMKELCNGEDTMVWVDEICIDQSIVKEKKHQVELMQEIYGRADAVCVWLGAATPQSDHILSHFENCDEDATNAECLKDYPSNRPKCGPRCSPARDLGVGILDRRWWTRTWVIQEVMLNEDVFVLCGTQTITFDALLDLADFAAANNYPTLPLPDEAPLKHLTAYKDGFRLPISILKEMRKRISEDDIPEFTEWIEAFHRQHTTHARDKIYGLYGLADPDKYSDFPITYETTKDSLGKIVFKVPDEEVFAMTTRAIVDACGKLDFICLGKRDGTVRSSLPSWVPDLRNRPHFGYSFWPLNYMSAPAFSASRRLANIRWEEGCMISKGFEIDRVESIGLVDQWHDDIQSGCLKPDVQDPFHFCAKRMAAKLPRVKRRPLAKTLVCDMGVGGLRLEPDEDAFSMRILSNVLPDFQPSSHIHNPTTSQLTEDFAHWRDFARHRWSYGRLFLITERGRFGIGPACTQPGDIVCILNGASVPYILRESTKHQSQRRVNNYTFLGESYIHGMMDGEVEDSPLYNKDDFRIF